MQGKYVKGEWGGGGARRKQERESCRENKEGQTRKKVHSVTLISLQLLKKNFFFLNTKLYFI